MVCFFAEAFMEKILEEQLKRKCSLGETEIFSGKGIAANIPATLKTIYEDGTICLICDDNTEKFALPLADDFKDNGYKVLMRKSKETSCIPEYVRFVFGVGSGAVAETIKRVARELEADCALLLTAPSTDTILNGYAPKQVFIDENIMINCPNQSIAAGWGIVLSEHISAFESYFAKKVLSGEAAHGTDKRNRELPFGSDVCALAVKLLEISYGKRGFDTADVMARLLYRDAAERGERPRLVGEYKFLCSCVLGVFYSNFLGSPAIDVMPPVSAEGVAGELEKLCGADAFNLDKRIDFFNINSYFRISYILGEYRMDLLERLSGADMHSTQRYWRRIYPDAGYWLKETLTSRDLIKALALAGELTDGLLGYAAATGFTVDYYAEA